MTISHDHKFDSLFFDLLSPSARRFAQHCDVLVLLSSSLLNLLTSSSSSPLL